MNKVYVVNINADESDIPELYVFADRALAEQFAEAFHALVVPHPILTQLPPHRLWYTVGVRVFLDGREERWSNHWGEARPVGGYHWRPPLTGGVVYSLPAGATKADAVSTQYTGTDLDEVNAAVDAIIPTLYEKMREYQAPLMWGAHDC
jgi:hypothetical protein